MKIEVASWLVVLASAALLMAEKGYESASYQLLVFFAVLVVDLLLFVVTGGLKFKRLSPYVALICVLFRTTAVPASVLALALSGSLLCLSGDRKRSLLKTGLGLSILPVSIASLVIHFYGSTEIEQMLATTFFMVISVFLPPAAPELRLSILPLLCSPSIVYSALHFLESEPLLLLALLPAVAVVSLGKDDTLPRLKRLQDAFSLSQKRVQAQSRQLERYSQILKAAQSMSNNMDDQGLEKALGRSLVRCGIDGARIISRTESDTTGLSLSSERVLELPSHLLEEQQTIARILVRIYQDCAKNVDLHTQVVEALEETRRSQARTLATSRLAAVGRMAAGVAHEVNTPVGAIVLSVDLGERYVDKDTDKVRSHFQLIRESAGEIMKSVKRFLQFSQPDRFEEKAWFRATDTVDDSLSLISFQRTRSKVEIDVSLPEDLEFFGRKYDFHTLLSNLLLNACQACAETECAKVTCTGLVQSDGTLLIEVVDNGPGVSVEHVPQLFQPFFTTKSSGEGTGLGLYLAVEAAESFGASMRYRENRPKGARFQVKFPGTVFRLP